MQLLDPLTALRGALLSCLFALPLVLQSLAACVQLLLPLRTDFIENHKNCDSDFSKRIEATLDADIPSVDPPPPARPVSPPAYRSQILNQQSKIINPSICF